MNREIRKIVNKNCAALEKSEMDFESIYNIMFANKNCVLAETNENFRIQKYSYTDVKKMIEKTACALEKKIGATHSYVALEMENCLQWIVAFWAILRSGNKPYLVNCRHTKNLSDTILKSLDIRYIICIGTSQLEGEVIDFNSLGEIKNSTITAEFENEFAISTSATSLEPTVCFYSGKEISLQILDCKGILKKSGKIATHYKGKLKQLAFLPFYHIFGLSAVYFWFTFFGRTLVFLKDFTPETILKTIRKHEVTHIFAVPVLWHTIEKQLVKQVEEKGKKAVAKFENGKKITTALQNIFPVAGSFFAKKIMREVTEKLFGKSVQFCISGGSYLRSSAMELFNALGYSLHNGYGMSEVGITSVELRNKPKDLNKNSIGIPFDSVEYKIDSNNILHIKGDTLCTATLKNGVRTETEGWFCTGDKVTCDNGTYFINGRESDVIIGENGENINPDIIEQNFTFSDADSFCVFGKGDVKNQTVAMVVRINKFLPADRIRNILSEAESTNNSLPLANQIREFYFTYDPLAPETAVKVGRKYLMKEIENNNINLIPFSEIKANIQCETTEKLNEKLSKTISRIISRKTGFSKEEIQPDTHLIADLGISSIQYFSVITELENSFSVSFSLGEENCYTLRDFCTYIERHI